MTDLYHGGQTDDCQEDSVALTDIFLNFRASYLNRARDIRDFAAMHNTLNINEEE